jgi:hypothetical protein
VEIPNCINLLQAMEIDERDEVEQNKSEAAGEESEMMGLLEEWIYTQLEETSLSEANSKTVAESMDEGVAGSEKDTTELQGTQGVDQMQDSKNKASKNQWGPVIPTRRSERTAADTRPMLTRAQETKRKWEQGLQKGNKK